MLSMQETGAMFPMRDDKAHDLQDSIDDEAIGCDHISIEYLVILALMSQADRGIIETIET